MKRTGLTAVAAVLAAWTLATPVEAYLDPGTGSALLQGIIGALAVGAGFIAHQWHRVRALFGGRQAPEKKPSDTPE